jgi:signal transduction histidine kinase
MNKKLKILAVEDNKWDAELVGRELLRSKIDCELRVVESREAYIEALENFVPDVILSDHALPSFSSLEALAIMKSREMDVPFLLVTGSVSERFAMECISAGVDDYILKQSLTRLPAAIINSYLKKEAERERAVNHRKLQDANNELKTFIYRASHDIRGPICSLKGLINVSKIDSEKEKESLEKLMNYMDKGVSKLDDVLMNLIETLQLKDKEVAVEPIQLPAMLKKILDEKKSVASNIKIEMSCNVEDEFYSDSYMVELVLRNIIDNSFRYYDPEKKEPMIGIGIAKCTDGIVIDIHDNGTGIRKELCGKAFDMFFRANERVAGNGLGLYLTKIAVEKLDGAIGLESEEGEGTSVHIYIPSSQLPFQGNESMISSNWPV